MSSLLVVFIIAALSFLMGIDGMRFVFRGTRDHLVNTQGCSTLAARIAASLAALAGLASGVAILITAFAWIGGVRPFSRRL
jgi:hypothetical protein